MAALTNVHLRGLGTAVPPHALPQDLVLQNARKILGPRYSQFERMAKTFTTSGVERRYSVAPLDWFQTPKNWPDRNTAYLDGATALFIDAAEKALADAGMAPEAVDCIVTVSSTGIATPTLEARAAQAMGFRADVQRVPLFGLGCAGGVSGLATATDLARARPGTNVLMVAVECCTLSFREDRLQKADIIATVLFGDGAAAAVVSSDGEGPLLGHGVQHMWDDTLAIMGWDVDENALGVIFDRSIPDFATQHFADAVPEHMRDRHFVCHPGGAKVVAALEGAMGVEDGSMAIERDVLRDFGNMSAPTVLFVLERTLANGATGDMALAALGPGFTVSFLDFTA